MATVILNLWKFLWNLYVPIYNYFVTFYRYLSSKKIVLSCIFKIEKTVVCCFSIAKYPFLLLSYKIMILLSSIYVAFCWVKTTFLERLLPVQCPVAQMLIILFVFFFKVVFQRLYIFRQLKN